MTLSPEEEFNPSVEKEAEIENNKETLGEVGDNIIDDMIKDDEKEGIRQEDFEIPISEEQREKLWKKITNKVNEIK
jgi:hypothetical protein